MKRRWSAWAPDGRTVVPIGSGPVASGYAKGFTPERIEKLREHGRRNGARAARVRWSKRRLMEAAG